MNSKKKSQISVHASFPNIKILISHEFVSNTLTACLLRCFEESLCILRPWEKLLNKLYNVY